jgi:hypothetical protein
VRLGGGTVDVILAARSDQGTETAVGERPELMGPGHRDEHDCSLGLDVPRRSQAKLLRIAEVRLATTELAGARDRLCRTAREIDPAQRVVLRVRDPEHVAGTARSLRAAELRVCAVDEPRCAGPERPHEVRARPSVGAERELRLVDPVVPRVGHVEVRVVGPRLHAAQLRLHARVHGDLAGER